MPIRWPVDKSTECFAFAFFRLSSFVFFPSVENLRGIFSSRFYFRKYAEGKFPSFIKLFQSNFCPFTFHSIIENQNPFRTGHSVALELAWVHYYANPHFCPTVLHKTQVSHVGRGGKGILPRHSATACRKRRLTARWGTHVTSPCTSREWEPTGLASWQLERVCNNRNVFFFF